MLSIDRWQEILETIRHNKLRTALTGLSVAWGIFMLVILLASGAGMQNAIRAKFADHANRIWIWADQTSLPHDGLAKGRQINLTLEDHEQIAKIRGVEHVSSRLFGHRSFVVRHGDQTGAFEMRPVHPEQALVEGLVMAAGRFLNQEDMARRRKVAVIGKDVSLAMFGDQSPLGQRLEIGGVGYLVVGIFDPEGREHGQRRIFIPLTTGQAAYNAGDRVGSIALQVDGAAGVAESQRIVAEIQRLLATHHRFSPDDKTALQIHNNVEEFTKINDIFVWIRVFVWIVGIGTLIAGIVGVSNIMLISVKERTKEIGVRKALGATPGGVIWLILQEAVLITAVAGYFGLVAAIGVVELADQHLPPFDYFRQPEVDIGVGISATVLLIACGALAGFFPARRAAAVNPVTALRDE